MKVLSFVTMAMFIALLLWLLSFVDLASAAEAPVAKPEVVVSAPCKGHTTADKDRAAGRGGRGYDVLAPVWCK